MLGKSKSLDRIESRLMDADIEEGSMRHAILACARSFKSSWIELGQYLVTVRNDKLYKEWGYLTFEAYCVQEIGIRRATSDKLIRSYYFLEQEEPAYVKKEFLEQLEAKKVPTVEGVHTLRQVKQNKMLGIADYEKMKQHVLEEGRPEKEIKDAYQAMVKSAREQQSPEEARQERKTSFLRRMMGTLRSLQREAQLTHVLPDAALSHVEKIIKAIEIELS